MEYAGLLTKETMINATLREMAATLPQIHESLLEITGVGRQKLEWFGEDFLSVIRHYAANKML